MSMVPPSKKKKAMSAVSDRPSERANRDTDQASGEMLAADKVPTMPPSAGLPRDLLVPETRGTELQPNPNSYADYVLGELLTASRRLEDERRALNLPKLLATQADDIKRHASANYELVRREVVALRQEVEALSKREEANAASIDNVRAEMRREMASLRAQFDALEARFNAAGITAPPR